MTDSARPSRPHSFRPDPRVFDERDALDRLGDSALLTEVLALFADDAKTVISHIESSLKSGDLVAASRHAHTLKGSAANISAGAVRSAAEACESAAKGGDSAVTMARYLDLESSLNELLVSLGRYLNRGGGHQDGAE